MSGNDYPLDASKTMHRGEPLKAREFYEARAKSIIKDLREQRQMSYKELARRLTAMGLPTDERILINRVNRGNYSFAFALQLLAAMDEDTVTVPKLAPPENRARK
jgi:hypothetical protein